MPITKVIKHAGLNLREGEWEEYEYLFNLIYNDKINPYILDYHPKEEKFDLMRKIAESNLMLYPLRTNLISLLVEDL